MALPRPVNIADARPACRSGSNGRPEARNVRLGGNARALIQDAAEVYVSAASAWEMAIKVALGKLRTTRRPTQAVSEAGFSELPITFEHTEALAGLPPHHTDPFDRLILAAAHVEG